MGVARPRGDVKYSATATSTTVAERVGEVRSVGIAKLMGTTEPDTAVSSGEAGPSLSRANHMNSAAAAAAVKSGGRARPPEIGEAECHDETRARRELR